MTNSWQTIHQRGQQTNAVWNTQNAAYTVGSLTLALHQTDVAALPPAGLALTEQEDVVDDARVGRDEMLEKIRDLGVRFPRVMDGALEPGDPLHGDLDDIRTIEGDGLGSIMIRGDRTLSCWKKINARNAAAVPVLPAVVVGGMPVADLAAALTALSLTTQGVEDTRSVLSDVRSALRTLAARVDRNNKRWYAAWEGNYPLGTPERDALSQIDTEGSGGGGGGTSPPLPPLPPGVPVLDSTMGSGGIATLTMSATGATLFNVYQRTPGEVDFGLVAGAVLSGWSSGSLTAGSGEWAWQVAGVADGVEGPRSATTMQGV